MIRVGAEGTAGDPGPPRAAAWLPFVLVTGLVTSLGAAGVLPRWPGLVHAVAPPPFDLALDLRLLVARAPSYGVFLLGLVASLLVRALVLASLLTALGDPRPFAQRAVAVTRMYVIAVVPLALAAGLEFAGLAAVYAWYAWAGLAISVLVCVGLAPRAVGSQRRAVLLWSIPALLGLGALARLGGEAVTVALVPVSALLTAVSLRTMRRPRSGGSAGRAALAVALVASMWVPPASSAPSQPSPAAVLFLVPGVDTSSGRGALYRFDPARAGFACDRVYYYSYTGVGPGAARGEARCPIRVHRPYVRTDTQRPLAQLVASFIEQLRAIRRDAARAPVAVVTHSQGAVIAWEALASGAARGVSVLVALAGFPRSPVGYPPPGQDGRGRIGADVLRGLSSLSRGLGWGTFSPDAPLAREVLARADGLERVFAGPLPPGVRAATVPSATDVIVAPEGLEIDGVPSRTADATHVGAATSADAYTAVHAVLRGEDVTGESVLARVLDAVVHALMPPPGGAGTPG